MLHRLARRLAPLLMFLLALAASQPALAHAQLLSTQPAANAVLADAPDNVALDFNEPVSPLAIALVAPDGSSSDLTAETTGGETLRVALPADLGQGTHVLSWRVVSVDAHPVAGALVFSIGAATGTIPDIATASPATSALLWAAKVGLFAGLFFGLGGAIFALAAPLRERGRGIIAGFAGLGLLAAPLSLVLHGADALGLPPGAILSLAPWETGFSTSYGLTVLLLAAALALALVSLFALRKLAWVGWILAAIALAISGHAGAAEPQWLTRSAVILHIAGILFWAGALLPLWFWLRDTSAAADKALSRFSRLVPFAVAAILASGIVLAMVQLARPGPAWLTPYGYILAAKLALLAVLFGLALWNRLRLTRPALLGEVKARRLLRASIRLEIVLVLAIFILAAGWRFTPPPRAIAMAEQAQAARAVPAYAHAMNDSVMADIVVTPGRSGPVDIDIAIIDLSGAPLIPLSVELTLAAPALGIEPFKTTAALSDGLWRVEGQSIPLPGLWELILDIRLDRFTLARIGADIQIP
jgi:copper transport protein